MLEGAGWEGEGWRVMDGRVMWWRELGGMVRGGG